MKKSDNTKGNPYHSEETGRFTSPNENDNVGDKEEQFFDDESLISKIEMPKKPILKAKVTDASKINELKERLSRMQSDKVSNIPFLQSSKDIFNNIEKFCTKKYAERLDKFYKKGNYRCSPYSYCPFKFADGDDGMSINMFVQELGWLRYEDKYCKTMNYQEYQELERIISSEGSGVLQQYYDVNGSQVRYADNTRTLFSKGRNFGCGLVRGYRGVSFDGARNSKKKLIETLNSYIGIGHAPTYSGQGCHGTVDYVAMSKNYAELYSDNYSGHVLKHIVDIRNAKVLYQHQVEEIRDELSNMGTQIKQKVLAEFSKHLPFSRAEELADGFVGSLRYDLGLTCVLMGGDCLIAGIGNGNQIDILNWGIAKILKDW